MKTLLAGSIVIGIALAAPVQASQLTQAATVPGIATLAQGSEQAAPAQIKLAARTFTRTRGFRRLGSSGRRHIRGLIGPRAAGSRNRTSNRRYQSAHRRAMRARARAAIRRARLRNRGRF